MHKFFLKVYHFFEQNPAVMWGLMLVTIGLCVISALRLDFVEDISSFLPSNGQNERINYAYEHLGGDNRIVVNIGMADTEQDPDVDLLSEAADLFAETLGELDTAHHAKQVLASVDVAQISEVTEFVLQNLPYFLSDEDYARLDSMLSPEYINRQIANDKQLLASPIPMMRTMIQHDPLFISSNVLQSLNAFKMDDSYHSESDHIFNQEGNEALVVVSSNYPISETKNNAVLIQNIDKAAEQVMKALDGKVKAHSFGASQVSLTNSRQIKKDSFTAIGLALIFILALLIYYYRNARSIILIFLSTLFGGLFALGVIALVKNPVSVIAIGVASIIIGIAINYPIHVLSHFKRTDDKEQIIKDIVTPLLIGNITTVGAFISLLFISSPAMKDLGLFSALLLVGTIIFVLVFLPHLMGKHFQGKERGLAFRPVAEFKPENVKGIFWAVVALTVVFAVYSKRTAFDTNMHHINYMTKEQQAEFDKLRAQADTSVVTLYMIAEGETLNDALTAYENSKPALDKVAHMAAVKNVTNIGNFLPAYGTQLNRLNKWKWFWHLHKEEFFKNLDKAAVANGFTPEAFQPCKDIINATYEAHPVEEFDLIGEQFASNYVYQGKHKSLVYSILKVNKNDAEKVELTLNDISPDVFAFTDSSIASRLVDSLSDDFNYVLYICGIIVFAFLLFTFGRIELSVMAFLPLFTAWIWILGIMGMTGIQFNIVNIILATFIFGMGDDYSIFVTEGLIYEYKYGRKMLSQFKNSIILSASIMFIGIGMLIFAKHPAMKSLAEVTIIGMFSVVLMANVIPPIIFKWLTMRKGRPRRQPVTSDSLFRSVIGFPYFFFGVCVLSCGGFIWLTLGKRNDENKLKYHKLLKKMMLSTAYRIPRSTFKVLNPHNEDFEKPAIIICNHQSHFDLLYTLSLHPKIIVLTNDWAWNTPLYRRIVRNADYLPASYGMDSNLTKIKEMVDKGYSVLVFPEGTRSVDHNILRFHQGAFQMAEQLGLDILPIITHGIGDQFPKHDTCIHRGDITVAIRQRVKPDDPTFRKDKTVLETTRLFRHYYVEEFGKLKEQCETPDYLTDIVLHNYIYKGKDVQRECRRKFLRLGTLCANVEDLPDGTRLLYKNCGNGEFSLMTALLKKHIQVTAYDADTDRIALASHCFSVPENLTYTHELPDATDFDVVLNEAEILNSRYNI